jgi:hypothetical protein
MLYILITADNDLFLLSSRPLYQEPHPRRWVVPLLYISVVGHLVEIGVLIAGTYFIATAYQNPGKIQETFYLILIKQKKKESLFNFPTVIYAQMVLIKVKSPHYNHVN